MGIKPSKRSGKKIKKGCPFGQPLLQKNDYYEIIA
jgi:hypothetical protein